MLIGKSRLCMTTDCLLSNRRTISSHINSIQSVWYFYFYSNISRRRMPGVNYFKTRKAPKTQRVRKGKNRKWKKVSLVKRYKYLFFLPKYRTFIPSYFLINSNTKSPRIEVSSMACDIHVPTQIDSNSFETFLKQDLLRGSSTH